MTETNSKMMKKNTHLHTGFMLLTAGALLLLGQGCATQDPHNTGYQDGAHTRTTRYNTKNTDANQQWYPQYTTIYVAESDSDRFRVRYDLDNDGLPVSIRKGRESVIFYGSQSSINRLNRSSSMINELRKYNVTILSVVENDYRSSIGRYAGQDYRNQSNVNNPLSAVVYNRKGHRAYTWNESQGQNRLINQVRNMNKKN